MTDHAWDAIAAEVETLTGGCVTTSGRWHKAMPLLDLSAWAKREPPEQEWALRDWMPARQATYLTGPGSAGKSLLTQQLCTCVALGIPFMGVETRQAPALYVTCEDDADTLERRQKTICEALGVDRASIVGKLHLVSLAGHTGTELATFGHTIERDELGQDSPTMRTTPQWSALSGTAKAIGAKFIGLDNVAHLFAGNENIRNEVAAFVSLLNRLAMETGGAVLFIGHPNKAGDAFSGSTAWENQVRSRLFLGTPKDADGNVLDADARVLSRPRLGDDGKHFSRMTVDELRGLDETVKQIVHLGRWKNKLLKDKAERDLADVAATIADQLYTRVGGREIDLRTRNTPGALFKNASKRFLAMHRKMASLARQMDGSRDGGPLWEHFIGTMNESADLEAKLREEATMKLHVIMKPALAEGKMGGKGMFFAHLGISLNREERIGLVANLGNAGNTQRLLDGEGWTRGDLDPVLDSLSKTDMDLVQALWDFFEGYRPMIGAKEKRVYGIEPEWIEPVELETRHGTYRGGYYPIKYDPRRSGKAEQHADAEEARRQMKGAYIAATPRRSFAKSRVEEVKGRPLIYNLTGLYQGTNEVIHDLSWHEWLIDVNKLLRHPSIDGAMRSQYGPEAIGVYKSAIQDIAAGDIPAQNVFESAVNRVRMGATVAGLGWNFKTALLQPFGLTQSMVRIGPAWVARGMVQWLKSPLDTVGEITAKSTFMRLRSKTQQREINEIQNRVTGGKSKLGEYVEASFFIMIQKAQLIADVPTWLGQYEKSFADGNSEERSIALADQAVRDAQGGGQISDLSAIQRGGPLQKLFTNFISFFNVTHNIAAESVARTDFRKPGEVMRLALDFLLLYSVPASFGFLLAEAFRAMGGGDDDDWVEGLIAENISFMLGTIVGIRELTSAAQSIAGVRQFEGSYGGPAGLRVLQEADKLGKQVDQGEMDRGLRKSLINTAGIVFMKPSGQINKTWDGAEALAAGETDNPAVLISGSR